MDQQLSQTITTKLLFPTSKKMKNEKEFTSFLGRECKERGRFFYKIPDTWFWHKPYDCIIVADGHTLHVELKVTKSTKTKIYNKLRPNQHASLAKVEKNWGIGLVGVLNIPLQKYKFSLYKDIDLSFIFDFNV